MRVRVLPSVQKSNPEVVQSLDFDYKLQDDGMSEESIIRIIEQFRGFIQENIDKDSELSIDVSVIGGTKEITEHTAEYQYKEEEYEEDTEDTINLSKLREEFPDDTIVFYVVAETPKGEVEEIEMTVYWGKDQTMSDMFDAWDVTISVQPREVYLINLIEPALNLLQ